MPQVPRVQIFCSSIGPALPVIENLELMTDYRHGCSWDFSRVISAWHAFLRSFGGVKTRRIDMTFAKELSRALDPTNGAVIKDLLPVPSELVVVPMSRGVWFINRFRHLSMPIVSLATR